MESNTRIPPAVHEVFVRVASQVCDRSRMDYEEWLVNSQELAFHLQERWREGVEQGLNDEAAARRALKLFGDPATVARSLRRPWLVRLLTFRRFRSERFYIFVVGYFLFTWNLMVDSNWEDLLRGSQVTPFQILLPFGAAFFNAGIGAMFVGLAAAAGVVVSQWKPMFKAGWLNQLLQVRHLALLVTGFALYEAGIHSVLLAVKTLPVLAERFSVFTAIYYPYCCFHVIVILAGWFGSVCILSEVLGHNRNLGRTVVVFAGMLATILLPHLPATTFALQVRAPKNLPPSEEVASKVDGYTKPTGVKVELWLEKKRWFKDHQMKVFVSSHQDDARRTVTWRRESRHETFDFVYYYENGSWKFHDVYFHDMKGIRFDLNLSLIINEPSIAQGFLILRNPDPLTADQKRYVQLYFNSDPFTMNIN